jgi:hypothetical protein
MKIPQLINAILTVVKNILLGVNIISLSLLRNPMKMIEYISENLFLYRNLCSKSIIDKKNVFQVLSGGDLETIQLGNLRRGGAWFTPLASYASDIVSLCLICKAIKPLVVFEIGTFQGYTSFHFALNTSDDTKIYTLDLPKSCSAAVAKLETTITDDAYIKSSLTVNKYLFEGTDVEPKITCLFGDSAEFDFSHFLGKVDFFFIDGAHSYDYVKSDTLNALKCCHKGSVIAWHDYGRVGVNGVTKWLLELAKENKIYSIPGGSLAFMVVE